MDPTFPQMRRQRVEHGRRRDQWMELGVSGASVFGKIFPVCGIMRRLFGPWRPAWTFACGSLNIFPRIWNTAAAPLTRVDLFCVGKFERARGEPTQLHRELRPLEQSAPPPCRNAFRSTNTLSVVIPLSTRCALWPQRWLGGQLGRLATYLME